MQSTTKSNRVEDSGNIEQPLVFRNYEPQTKLLEDLYVIEKTEPETIHSRIQDKLKLIEDNGSEEERYKIDSKFLDPQKIDYDLKRRIQPRMDKLNRRTKREIDRYIKSSKSKK